MRKISKKRFVEALVNNDDGLNNQELASQLGISKQYFYKLKAKWTDELRIAARQIAVNYATQAVKDLLKQSKDGKTNATTALLELAKVKERDSLLDSTGNWKISIERIEPKPTESGT